MRRQRVLKLHRFLGRSTRSHGHRLRHATLLTNDCRAGNRINNKATDHADQWLKQQIRDKRYAAFAVLRASIPSSAVHSALAADSAESRAFSEASGLSASFFPS